MARCLFVVADTFPIKGRGLVLVPGILPLGEERFRIGDPIVLKRPDGSRLDSRIGAAEHPHSTPPRPKNEILIVLKDLTKEDVPVGSEVWSVEA